MRLDRRIVLFLLGFCFVNVVASDIGPGKYEVSKSDKINNDFVTMVVSIDKVSVN